jgi:hypothetical protein
MHVSSTVPVISSQPQSPGKSQVVPPGLAKRGLDLPPGIAKKQAAEGTGWAAPAGIAKRFPAAALQPGTTSETSGTETDGAPPALTQDNTTPTSVDLLV